MPSIEAPRPEPIKVEAPRPQPPSGAPEADARERANRASVSPPPTSSEGTYSTPSFKEFEDAAREVHETGSEALTAAQTLIFSPRRGLEELHDNIEKGIEEIINPPPYKTKPIEEQAYGEHLRSELFDAAVAERSAGAPGEASKEYQFSVEDQDAKYHAQITDSAEGPQNPHQPTDEPNYIRYPASDM